jgi:hypothetical protein
MELEKIWMKFNVSFILILPIFSDIIKHIKSKDGYNISIHSLFYSAGLLNTFRFETPESNINCLKLVFDKNKLLNYTLYDVVNKPIKSLLDLITCSRYFVNLKMDDDLIIIYLKIDNRWLKDIQLIEESNYSKVSKEYKEEVLYQGVYELSDEPIIDYIYIKNIPAKILNKHESLLTAINEIFKTSYELHQVDNLFDEFNIKKETYKWNL